MKSSFIFCLLLFISFVSAAQDYDLSKLPSTKEEFVKSEPDFIAAAKWLETTKIAEPLDKRTQVNAWVVAWLTNSPTVTIELGKLSIHITDKNSQLIPVFMAAYGRYCLENNYSKDALKCNLAATKAVINCYNLGGDVKKNKDLTKAIEADKEGKLEDWVKNEMNSK